MLELTTMTKSENSAKSKWRTQASQKYFYDHVQRPQEGPFVAQSGKWTFGRGFLYSVSLLTTVGKTLIFFSLIHNYDKLYCMYTSTIHIGDQVTVLLLSRKMRI